MEGVAHSAGFQNIEGFQPGRDVVATSGSQTTISICVSSPNHLAWVQCTAGAAITHGVVFNGISTANISAHESSVRIGGVSYPQIS
jgi:uncharacterized protein (DUF1330 family)